MASHAVAMDAKYQKATEIVIGYPDKPGDGATNFDAVLHFTTGPRSTSYQDTGLQLSPTFTSIPCLTGTPGPQTPGITPGALIVTGHTLTVQATSGSVTASPSSGALITVNGGTTGGTLTVNQVYANDGSSCVAAYAYNVTAGATPVLTHTSTDFAELKFPTSPGSSQFTFLDSDTAGAFSFTGLPAGISVSGGTLTASTSTAVPGTYTNVGVTFTATDGAVFTATFTLTVSAVKTVNPGAHVPYYTFVFAKAGVWSNMCVTDINGSGALKLQTCTLGKNQYQDFYALDGSGHPSQALTGGGQFSIQNRLAAVANPAGSCLTDPSSLNPGTPQSDPADEAGAPIFGRQLRTDGSCTSTADKWSWAS
jgi:hypothetical protein